MQEIKKAQMCIRDRVMSDEAAAKTAEVAANMTYLELSTYPGYMDSFVAACFLPHTDKRLFPHSIQEA